MGDDAAQHDGALHHQTTALCADCPGLRFASKFADIDALNGGDGAALRPILSRAARERLAAMPPASRETALVVGGNGFVGAHLTARLSRDPRISRVWATVRAAPDASPAERLRHTLNRYRVSPVDFSKIELLDADPTRPMFGLLADRYRDLAGRIDLVFSCASSSDYDVGYLDLREAWLKGLLRVLHFATEGRRKHVTYLGSISAYFYQRMADFRRPDSWWYSGYSQMKWVNGQLLRWLAADELLPVTLCETPYVLGATDRGIDPGNHYSWWRIIEIAHSIGLLWDGPGMSYIPVDVLVDVLATNALSDRPLARLLPRNPVPYDNRLLAELLGVETVCWDRFLAEAARQVSPRRVATLLSSNFDELVRITNEPSTVLPPAHVASWCDNRRLFRLYLDNLHFRDVRLAARHAGSAHA